MKDDLKRKGAEFWNEHPCGGQWRSYRDYMDWVQRTEPYIYRVFDHYEWKEKHVLEVGCGQGSALNYGSSLFQVGSLKSSLPLMR